MASIFTYDPSPLRVSSPWSASGSTTPITREAEEAPRRGSSRKLSQSYSTPMLLQDTGVTKLEAEPQEGSTEYKLHLLLRPGRTFTSSSTGMDIYGSSYSRLNAQLSNQLCDKEFVLPKSGYAPSNLTRQMRLQQLTTQLLWRLQQSSPFHSSSPGNLILPKLPEASPKLGVPANRAPLLPGLEESQGALYEIGVSDDGALVGLIEEELEESLVNLKAMAASLGCVVQLLRKVAVGKCEWLQPDRSNYKERRCRGTLWVAEALVCPDLEPHDEHHESRNGNVRTNGSASASIKYIQIEAPRSQTEQLRVTLAGSTGAGKSSLLGTLSTSTLDNGRGKSRLSLLRHRHEITSGITSSVAQELIGYHNAADEESRDTLITCINYATSDVSSWIDIHHLARRLVFISDSPGQARYAKSTFRTLVSWKPHWTIVCIPADEDEAEKGKVDAANRDGDNAQELHSSLAYLALCLQLQLPMVVAITKMDLATRAGLRSTLGRVLSVLKEADRKPTILSNTPMPPGAAGSYLQTIEHAELSEIDKMLTSGDFSSDTVPIVLTCAVTGVGMGKLHALLSSLPLFPKRKALDMAQLSLAPFSMSAVPLFHTDEVFMIPPSKVYGSRGTDEHVDHGVVLCGTMARDSILVGDSLVLGPFGAETNPSEKCRFPSPRRSSSYSPALSKSQLAGSPLLDTRQSTEFKPGTYPAFVDVRVVSIRNLRLPVRTLLGGQVGTVGVQPVDPEHGPRLSRARKGMILIKAISDLAAYRSITATFSAAAFMASTSPTLVLGGHATIYVNAVRAAVKVTSLIFAPNHDDSSSVFDFEDEPRNGESQEVKITFRFISSVEWMSIGDMVLVVPTATASGPIAGQVHSAGSTSPSGFVGTVSETTI